LIYVIEVEDVVVVAVAVRNPKGFAQFFAWARARAGARGCAGPWAGPGAGGGGGVLGSALGARDGGFLPTTIQDSTNPQTTDEC
jgi:hypothetical protein